MEECPRCGKLLMDREDEELHFDLHPKCKQFLEVEANPDTHPIFHNKHVDGKYRKILKGN